ncbi:major facilitator superfamily domain-containing protein [Aspergillus alliaceus]|uniref:Major facilitator superfamily domain-containing protein n=1 Tax=Petromyces alliaceus TaxID=209559 RepID=A0A5N7BTN0_PETAA|nr:major facilitator superfamily domain-containing protein [Aspergillus alliaceus]
MSRPTNKGHPLSPSGTTKDSSSEKTWVDGRRDEKEQLWAPTDVTPDGGLTAWLMVLDAWCVLFCSFGWINSIGVFQAYYEHDLLHQYSRRSHGFHRCRYSSSTSSIPSWFNKKRGAVYGTVASGSIISGVTFPIIISKLILTVGFWWTMRVSAYMILFLLILANLTIKSRVPPNPCKLFKETLARPFHEFKAVLLIVGFFILTFSIFVPMNYLVSVAIGEGMGRNVAEHLVAILNAGSLFSRLSAGIFADKIGSYNIFVVVSYIAGIVVLALWIPAMSNAGNIVFDILFGFATGAYVALAPGLVVKLSPFAEIGYRTGLLFLFASIGGLTTNPIAGAIWQHSNGSYTGMKVFSGRVLDCRVYPGSGVRLHQTGLKLKAIF